MQAEAADLQHGGVGQVTQIEELGGVTGRGRGDEAKPKCCNTATRGSNKEVLRYSIKTVAFLAGDAAQGAKGQSAQIQHVVDIRRTGCQGDSQVTTCNGGQM